MFVDLFSNKESEKYQIIKNNDVFNKKYVPTQILHRDIQIKQVANGLRSIMRGQHPTSMALFGKRGTGKTLIALYVIYLLRKANAEVGSFYISLKDAKTDHQAIKIMVDTFVGKSSRGASLVSGNTFRQGFDILFDYIKSTNYKYIIFVIDEMNELNKPDVFLHHLLRLHEIYKDNEAFKELLNKEISYIFISNKDFTKDLSEGTKSSFSEVTKMIFPPYNADALVDILNTRVNEGLYPGVCEDTVVPLCAAYGASEQGDARHTIELLAKAAQLAEDNNDSKITDKHVERAREILNFDIIKETLLTLPTQLKVVALACIWDIQYGRDKKYISTTGSVYKEYLKIAREISINVMTQRRVADMIVELSELGFVRAIVTQGKGRTREISLEVPTEMQYYLLNDNRLDILKNYQHTFDH